MLTTIGIESDDAVEIAEKIGVRGTDRARRLGMGSNSDVAETGPTPRVRQQFPSIAGLYAVSGGIE